MERTDFEENPRATSIRVGCHTFRYKHAHHSMRKDDWEESQLIKFCIRHCSDAFGLTAWIEPAPKLLSILKV